MTQKELSKQIIKIIDVVNEQNPNSDNENYIIGINDAKQILKKYLLDSAKVILTIKNSQYDSFNIIRTIIGDIDLLADKHMGQCLVDNYCKGQFDILNYCSSILHKTLIKF